LASIGLFRRSIKIDKIGSVHQRNRTFSSFPISWSGITPTILPWAGKVATIGRITGTALPGSIRALGKRQHRAPPTGVQSSCFPSTLTLQPLPSSYLAFTPRGFSVPPIASATPYLTWSQRRRRQSVPYRCRYGLRLNEVTVSGLNLASAPEKSFWLVFPKRLLDPARSKWNNRSQNIAQKLP
jgi:hypothetical protein